MRLCFPAEASFKTRRASPASSTTKTSFPLPKKRGKKLLLLGQGVGPLNSFLGKRKAMSAFNDADAVSVQRSLCRSSSKGLGLQAADQISG